MSAVFIKDKDPNQGQKYQGIYPGQHQEPGGNSQPRDFFMQVKIKDQGAQKHKQRCLHSPGSHPKGLGLEHQNRNGQPDKTLPYFQLFQYFKGEGNRGGGKNKGKKLRPGPDVLGSDDFAERRQQGPGAFLPALILRLAGGGPLGM